MVEEDKSLVIKKLRMEDTGMYQCLATNEAGSDYVSTWLKVKSEYQLSSLNSMCYRAF